MRLIILGLFAFVSVAAQATVQQEAMAELENMKRVFSFAYAPREWKKQHTGWDLDKEFATAQGAVAAKSDLTLKEYRKIANDFLRSTTDYHVSTSFASTEKAVLPFTIVGSQGRYFVSYIDRTKLSTAQFPINTGDEVLEFGGKPIAEVVKEFKKTLAWSVEETDESLAQLFLTRRTAKDGVEVPQGPVDIKVNHKDEATQQFRELSVQVTWEYTPEDVSWKFNSFAGELTRPNSFNKQMVWGGWRKLKDFDEDDSAKEETPAPNPFSIGTKKSWVPALGPKIWESEDKAKLYAYIFRSSDGKIVGYVRIPHYGGSTDEVAEFKTLMKKFEASTDALVIDEVNNPGGSLFYIYALQSLLVPNSSFAPPHQIALNPLFVQEAGDEMRKLALVKNDKDAQKAISEGKDNIDGYPVSYEFAKYAIEFYRFILGEWNAGRTLTNPTYLWGVDRINQNKDVVYTKPILILVNSLCFSGGDFFPSMLQDNKRATIFGTRTAGAGGWVEQIQIPSRTGMEYFSITGSLAWRLGDKPIENLGVTPDVNYEPTPDDFMNGFEGYKKAVNETLSSMIKPRSKVEVPEKP